MHRQALIRRSQTKREFRGENGCRDKLGPTGSCPVDRPAPASKIHFSDKAKIMGWLTWPEALKVNFGAMPFAKNQGSAQV
jgi:hypothetical protein